jgi:mannan endo-1,4-beta-mannosidase
MLVAIVVAAICVATVALRLAPKPSHRAAHASAPPTVVAYLGVYEAGAPHSIAAVAGFARAVGREPNLIGYFGGWAEPFATGFAEAARSHGAATLVQIDPTDASVAAIASGGYDDYLRSFADSVRDFGHPVVIGFGHEMNAQWYSWGYGHVPAATFVAAWRHIVMLFRAQGADNVTWLWTVQADSPQTGPVQAWWPGARYVTWVGVDGYYYRPTDTFASVFGATIDQIRTFTSLPVLLSETAVGPAAGQFTKIQDLFRGMAEYRTLGLVWFDIAQHDGIYHQDWRIEDSAAARTSFRLAVREYLAARGPAGGG